MRASRTTIAGILIPDSAIAREAAELVQDVAPPLLFHHSSRVFLWGSLQGEQLGLDYDTTPEIPRYKQPEVRLVTVGVGVGHARFQD
jgi:hypothetical protein